MTHMSQKWFMKFVIVLLLLIGTATAGEKPCDLTFPTQYELDLYFSICMDTLLNRCIEMKMDPLLSPCGSRVGSICLKAVTDYEDTRIANRKECLLRIPDSVQKK